MKQKLDFYLKNMVEHHGSDLHIKSYANIRVRVNGVLQVFGTHRFSSDQVTQLAKEITTPEQFENLQKNRSLDFAYRFSETHRFRVNFFYQMDGLSAVFRTIPTNIPSLDTLGLPQSIDAFAEIPRGLVLVTGVTGSGKSTTLAALLHKINSEQKKHIIAIEDPIEFIHRDNKCLINQRSIGSDTHSFSDALRAALREDPDIILVGEMRDLETIDIALHAANTGHLVFSTLHTLDAKETIDRIIGMFSKEEQNRVRMSLASVLEGVVSQRLVPTVDGSRVPAVEVLKKTARIKQLIAENRDFEIPDALADGKDIYGTQTFDQSIFELCVSGKITQETALEFATSKADMKLRLSGVGEGSKVLSGDTPNIAKGDIFAFKEEDS